MRVVVITAEERERAKEIIAYAEAHVWRPFIEHGLEPGLRAEHRMMVPMGIRCVFSITELEGRIYRHLTLSLHDGGAPGRLVSPDVAFEIAGQLFGFTGDPDDWYGGRTAEPGVVAVFQLLRPDARDDAAGVKAPGEDEPSPDVLTDLVADDRREG